MKYNLKDRIDGVLKRLKYPKHELNFTNETERIRKKLT